MYIMLTLLVGGPLTSPSEQLPVGLDPEKMRINAAVLNTVLNLQAACGL